MSPVPFIVALIAVLIPLSAPAAPGEVQFLFTADTEGHLLPCPTCTGRPGEGGLARRATLIHGERQAAPDLVLIDSGNALFGAESLRGAGNAIAAAYALMGVDALNLSWRDFRMGSAATRQALQEAVFPIVSANVLDAATGRPIAKPYVMKTAGATRVAILGATEPPPGLEAIPHLQRQLEGLRIADPVDALRPVIARARGESDLLVLAWYGSARTLRRIQAAFAGDLAAIFAGGAGERDAAPLSKPAVARAGDGLWAMTAATLDAAKGTLAIRTLEAAEAVEAEPEMVKLLASLRTAAEPAPETGVAIAPAIPPRPAAGNTYPLFISGENRGLTLAFRSAKFVPRFGALAAPEGGSLLVLESEWVNRIPFTMIEQKLVPTEYRIPRLPDHLYVVDGSRLLRIPKEAAGIPGHVPIENFRLPEVGSKIEGSLVFPLSGGEIRSLEVRFYDFAHGHIFLPLVPAPAGSPPAPSGALEKNEVVEAGIFAIEGPQELAGMKAPPGERFLIIDIRARSLFTIDGDASAFDPKAKSGARLKVGTVADWTESRRYLQLVVDGEYAHAAMPAGGLDLPDEPRFLPDLFTGGRVAFVVPEKAESLELHLGFPNARRPDSAVIHPRSIAIAVEGVPLASPARTAIASISDGPFAVTVVGQAAGADFAGEPAGQGKRFLVLDVTVKNTAKGSELFQATKQIHYASEGGETITVDPVSFRGPRPPLEVLWIPAGALRSYQAAFRIPEGDRRLRLKYSGVTLAKVVDLKPLEGLPVRQAAGKPGERMSTPEVAAGKKAAGPKTAEEKEKTAVAETPSAPLVQRVPQGLAGVGLTADAVNHAIDRGADFLWNFIRDGDIKRDRRRLGDAREHSIASLALVHAGAHKRHADFDAHLREYLKTVEPERLGSYQAAILCMLIEAYGDPSYLPQLEAAAQYLLELQGEKGSWSYNRNLPRDFFKPPADDRVLKVSGGQALDGPAAKESRGRRTDWSQGVDGDNSNSQYALLGLHAASRSGFAIDPEVWRRSLASFRQCQAKDGGWHYHGQSPVGYGSMTCAGICSMALSRHELGEADPAADPAIAQGLAWLEKNFSFIAHPKHSPPEQWRFYYLYSLERVGRILDNEFIGPHEWYPVGARHLIDSQTAEGGWVGKLEEIDPRLATSFALLFLTRATATLKPVALARGGDGTLRTGIQLPKGNRYYFILDASGSMTAELDGQSKWEIARGAVSRLVEELPDNAEVALRVYGHRKRAIEEGASDDTALEVPLKRLVKMEIKAKIDALKPRGKTPLARSLLEAKRDLGSATAENAVTLVLLTDGGEDTRPRQDPVAAAAEIAMLKGVRFHIVGFDIGREDWKAQLEAMAVKGEGHYWPARSAASLLGELRSAVFGVPAGFTVSDTSGKAAGAGRFGDSLTLPEGRYLFRADYAGVDYEELFWINTAVTTSVVFNAARVAQLRIPSAAAGAAPQPPAKPAAGAPAAPPAAEPARPAAPAPSKTKFCTGCGAALGANAKFCAGCGKKAGG